MSSQRMFWISGASTLAVLLLIGGALLARSQRAEKPAIPTWSSAAPSGWDLSPRREKHRKHKEEEDDD